MDPAAAAALRRRRRRRVPDADRKRAPRACDRCKARKNKCVETPSGTCVRCLQGSHPCRFERERSPEDVVVPTTGDDTHTNNVAAHAETTTDLKDDVDFSPTAGAPPSEAFMWPRFLTRLRSAFCLDTHPAPASPDTSHPQARPPPPADSQSPAELRRVRKAVRDFPPRGVAEFLLEVCITYGTDLFFYFDQAQLTAELGAFYSDEGCRLRSDTGFVCFVLAVFALGSHWTSLARPTEEDERLVGKEEDPGRIFYDQARILMADLIDRPCLRSVQAAYVLGVYLMPASAISASYVYMGLALRKALAIGLHLEPDEPGLSEDEKEMRRRLWWSVYSLERTVTIKLNRPRSISQDIITARLPRPVPRDAEQKFDNVQHQIVYAQLVRIIDKLSEPAAWSTNSPTNPVSTYEEALKSWKRSLPPPLKLQNIYPKSPGYRAVFHLHLNYYFAWIDMGKVSVVTVVRARLRALFCPSDPPPAPSAAVEQAADACIRAAKKMLELFEGLSRSGNMARFSFTDLQGCSIATIVVLLAGILQRDAGYDGRVAFGLDCLRRMAGGGNATAGMGVRFVEALRGITDEARGRLLRVQRTETAPSVEGRTTGYGDWAEWLATAEVAESSSEDEEDEEGSGEQPADVDDGGASVPDVELSETWDEAAALQLQELSASGFELPLNGVHNPELMELPAADEGWLASFPWSDDQMYLMGLTGMDVLDFTGGLE
ncbi:putative transcriptional regulatory protein C3C7.04 [Colletotrichum gloeosporioides]|uniref:Putative transcriptional regulatory protein C3C7.04 n=1 Tax=Colletotrichum gloeosporioides TaxID=474922 RepID=A0A8H4CTP8_COLGL|nr:putative transcriptional regulatory protein C3C7.04 [Colletotrichum gloeosporioides]KAF3809759.1 putative transcriptional regulatory protein C3C7.04 [Colletotrichum gloeosporioides]